MLFSFCRRIIDLAYPHICVICDAEAIQRPSIFCIKCASNLPYAKMDDQRHNEFEKHFTGRLHIEAGSSLFYFSKGGMIQEVIHTMKYKNLPYLGFYMGKMLGYKLKNHSVFKTCEAIAGIPLHVKKKRTRGYNQADFIAKGVASELHIPVLINTIRRGRMTASQTRKSRAMRIRNMADGFHVSDPHAIMGKHILLVDDVLTSGATLDFCGQEILKHPHTRLSLATLAMGSVV